MTFIILITATSMAMILTSFDWMPNIKPFNCPSCLSSWIALAMLMTLQPSMWWCFPIAYLLTSIFLIYERKQ